MSRIFQMFVPKQCFSCWIQALWAWYFLVLVKMLKRYDAYKLHMNNMFISCLEYMYHLLVLLGFWYSRRLEKSKWLPFSQRVDNSMRFLFPPSLQSLTLIHPLVHQIMRLLHILHRLRAWNRIQGIPGPQRITRFSPIPHVLTAFISWPFLVHLYFLHDTRNCAYFAC